MMYWKLGIVDSGTRLEQHFQATETPGADRDDVSVWEFVGLLLDKFCNRSVNCVLIQTNVAQILFTTPSSLPLCGGSERAPSVTEVLQVTFVEGSCVRRIVRIRRRDHRASRSVQRQDSLDRHLAQYLHPALSWRHRSHHGVRGRPQRSPRREGSNTHLSKDTLSQNGHGSTVYHAFFGMYRQACRGILRLCGGHHF